MRKPRIFFRLEGGYFLFVILFVLGGAVLRQVNLLVGLGGLMAAALLIHYQLILQSLSRLSVLRNLPARICAGDLLEVEVAIQNRRSHGALFPVEFRESVTRVEPANSDPPGTGTVVFPLVEPNRTSQRRYTCSLTRRGVYRFDQAELLCRYPFGLLEGVFALNLTDRLVVCPKLAKVLPAWQSLIDAEHDGQQRTRHRKGLLEADFYALREWRNGDSRRWIHWRTSAKIGTLAVRQFEQRRSSDLAVLCDLWQPRTPQEDHLLCVERVIACAAAALVDVARHGGANLTFVLAGKTLRMWHGSASTFYVQELLEQLAVCEASPSPDLVGADRLLNEQVRHGTRVIALSTRARPAIDFRLTTGSHQPRIEQLAEALWLDDSTGGMSPYFSCDAEAFPA